MSLGQVLELCIKRRDWQNLAKITGMSIDKARQSYDTGYRRDLSFAEPVKEITGEELPEYLRAQIAKRVINGKPMTFRQFSVFSGLRASLISATACGCMFGQETQRRRVMDALKRLDAATDAEIRAALAQPPPRVDKAPLTTAQKQWADDVKARLTSLDITIYEFAKIIQCRPTTLYNVTRKVFGAGPNLTALVEHWLDKLEADKAQKGRAA